MLGIRRRSTIDDDRIEYLIADKRNHKPLRIEAVVRPLCDRQFRTPGQLLLVRGSTAAVGRPQRECQSTVS